jgi:mRNA-degrading endonuclease toxin of MazEF toxin-antitoxin module
LILSVAFRDDEKAYFARSTQTRGGRFEVVHVAPNFMPGVFDTQNIGTGPLSRLVRFLTRLPAEQLAVVENAVQRWRGLAAGSEVGQ